MEKFYYFKNNLSIIKIELFVGLVVGLILWGSLLFQAGVISQDIAKDCKIILKNILLNFFFLI